MPLKTIIIIFSVVGIAALIKPAWTFFFIWAGGMALLWVMTGQWLPPATHPKKPDSAAADLVQAEEIKPLDASMEAEELDDLARMDGIESDVKPGSK